MFHTELFCYLQRNEKKENAGSLPRIKLACPESSWKGERARAKNDAAGKRLLQQCAGRRPAVRSRRVAGIPGRRVEAELLLLLGRGPLHRGVLQQLMHTEFSFPGEQKDWYPAEAMRQAAEEAHDLRYMIPATGPKELG